MTRENTTKHVFISDYGHGTFFWRCMDNTIDGKVKIFHMFFRK